MELRIRKANENECQVLYKLATEDEKWIQYNGPYFGYTRPSEDEFRGTTFTKLLDGEAMKIIEWQGKPIGIVSYYWEDKKTRWLECGVVIYDSKLWGKGIAQRALTIWISKIFETKELERVGLTTWSGNPAMMRCAEKVGFQLEARLRKVRYFKGEYYDSVKYGILKEEWASLKKVN